MRVQMNKTYATPTVSAQPGQVIDLPQEQAQQLVDIDAATLVDPPPKQGAIERVKATRAARQSAARKPKDEPPKTPDADDTGGQ